VAVNLSARQLRQPNVQYVIDRALQDAGVSPGQLELELTESLLVAGDEVAATLRSISALGVRLAIDDFGTGYSSLAYLKRFCVDTLKIDRSFVMEMPGNAEDGAISAAIIALARRLHLRVVAEGVETAAQQALLRELGCDEMQGYLLSPPMPAEAFLPWWHAHVPHGEAARSDRMALNP
jgi:EAL domain-containing protein (putative c-di-GMP-specific phosphodiesterase class I)